MSPAAQRHQTNFLAVEGQLAHAHIAIAPAPHAIDELTDVLGQRPLGELEGEHHSADRVGLVADNVLHGIERVGRRNIHIGGEPPYAAEILFGDFGAPAADVQKIRMRGHQVVDFRGIDADHKQPTFEQRLRRTAGRATQFRTNFAPREGQGSPFQGFGHLEIGAANPIFWRNNPRYAPHPTGGTTACLMNANPPFAWFDNHDIEDPGVGLAGCLRSVGMSFERFQR